MGGGRKARKARSCKRKKKDASSIRESESEGREGPKAALLNVVLRFEWEVGAKQTDTLKLTKIIRRLVGKVKYARILGDRNLLIRCLTEVQVEKAKNMTSVRKVKECRVVRVGEKRFSGCKGVIGGIPLSVNIRKTWKSWKTQTPWKT